jgi:hypothetical protein
MAIDQTAIFRLLILILQVEGIKKFFTGISLFVFIFDTYSYIAIG